MHSHRIKNPLLRTFTDEETKALEEKRNEELRQQLIQERLNAYQIVESDNSELKKDLEKKVAES